MQKTFIVYARGAGIHPPPNDPCFSIAINAETRREAIQKVTTAQPALANAHKNCTWDAYVKVPTTT